MQASSLGSEKPLSQEKEREMAEQQQLKAQFIKQEARAQLDPVIRRFTRKKTAFQRSEGIYLERLYLWVLTFATLQGLQETPGTFAGDVPERDSFAYSDFCEAAENLLSDISVYLERYSNDSDLDHSELAQLQKEAKDGVLLPNPGCGSRLQDAIDAMRGEAFKKVVADSDPRIKELTLEGGGHVINAGGKAIKMAEDLLQRFLNH